MLDLNELAARMLPEIWRELHDDYLPVAAELGTVEAHDRRNQVAANLAYDAAEAFLEESERRRKTRDTTRREAEAEDTLSEEEYAELMRRVHEKEGGTSEL